jgi:hypothetical protein
MITEVYEALIEAGVSSDKAKKAAESVIRPSTIETDIAQLKTDIGWIKIVGTGFCGIIVTMLGWIIVKLVQ